MPSRQDLWVWLDEAARAIEMRPGFDVYSALDMVVLNARRDGCLEIGVIADLVQRFDAMQMTDVVLAILIQLAVNRDVEVIRAGLARGPLLLPTPSSPAE